MMTGYLILHGRTPGNLDGRYVGKRTNEELSPEGKEQCKNRVCPRADVIYTSPLRRCVQTASLLYPDRDVITQELLSECDFGIFEGKNYKELSGEPLYQQWIDSRGTLPFPGGESREQFQTRCLQGFFFCLEHCMQNRYKTFAMVVHGGTIMSILDALVVPHREYFEWQVKNLEGFKIQIEEQQWIAGNRSIRTVRKEADVWR